MRIGIKIGKRTLGIQISSHTITEVCERGECEECGSYGITAEQARGDLIVKRYKNGIVMNAGVFGVIIGGPASILFAWLLSFFA